MGHSNISTKNGRRFSLFWTVATTASVTAASFLVWRWLKKQKDRAETVATTASVTAASFLVWRWLKKQKDRAELPWVEKKQKDRAELEINMERFRSYADFDANKGQLVQQLNTGRASSRFLAAEELLEYYPQEACCLYALAENALNLMSFEEAVTASERLLRVMPHNSLAQELHAYYQKQNATFEEKVAAAAVSTSELPDNRFCHRWKPFTEIPEGLPHESDPTIVKLRHMWSSIRKTDGELAGLLIETMQREWAVETGRVENLYILSEGATRSLILHGISASAITSDPARSQGIEEGTADVLTIERIMKDQEAVIKRLEAQVGNPEQSITKTDLFDLHKAFTKTARFTETVTLKPSGDQKKIEVLIRRGKFKNQPNFPTRKSDNLVHEYCPVGKVDEEIVRLLRLVEEYGKQDVKPELLAAWLHHRFVQIHPFHDGNGRVARSLASLVLLKARLLPFTVKLRDRPKYFETLAAADRGDLTPFVDFIVRQQKETLLSALSWAGTRAGRFALQFRDQFNDPSNSSQVFDNRLLCRHCCNLLLEEFVG